MKTVVQKAIRSTIAFLKKFLPPEEQGTLYETTNGVTVIVSDELPPEANAMSLAMYSRDPRSFLVHLKHVLKVGWKKFLSKFYVGYGHKSIGDCGTTTICIEGVSMLCAKAIQQYLLYKGQEASTRYLDMSKQVILNFLGEKGEIIQKGWMRMYEYLLSILIPDLKKRFPKKKGQDNATWERAINAKAFDVARSFLPAGATTLVGWHTTLREARDHLLELRNHPLKEVRDVAKQISELLHKKYPASGFDKLYLATEAYVTEYMRDYAYMEPENLDLFWKDNFDVAGALTHKATLTIRPDKTDLPAFLRRYGEAQVRFLLDFGSFRDLQRHRSALVLMPPLTTKYGFHPWYLDQIPEEHRATTTEFIKHQTNLVNDLACDEHTRQYYIAMGMQVACEVTGSLPAIVYITELRSGQTVHPTLRIIAQKMAVELQKRFPTMELHHDPSPDEWNIKRGNQTIIKKD